MPHQQSDARPSRPSPPYTSLFALSAPWRVLGAALISGGLWLIIAWALA